MIYHFSSVLERVLANPSYYQQHNENNINEWFGKKCIYSLIFKSNQISFPSVKEYFIEEYCSILYKLTDN